MGVLKQSRNKMDIDWKEADVAYIKIKPQHPHWDHPRTGYEGLEGGVEV